MNLTGSIIICCIPTASFIVFSSSSAFPFRTQTSWVRRVCWAAAWSVSLPWSDPGETTAAFSATSLWAWSWSSSCCTTWCPGFSADRKVAQKPVLMWSSDCRLISCTGKYFLFCTNVRKQTGSGQKRLCWIVELTSRVGASSQGIWWWLWTSLTWRLFHSAQPFVPSRCRLEVLIRDGRAWMQIRWEWHPPQRTVIGWWTCQSTQTCPEYVSYSSCVASAVAHFQTAQ